MLTFGEDRSLACELLQHLGGTGQSVTTLTYTDVQAELANTQLPHGVLLLLTLVLQINQTKVKSKYLAVSSQSAHAAILTHTI